MKMPSYSKMIKELRIKRSMTFSEIALKVGASPRSIVNYEKGGEPKNKEVAKKIIQLYETGEVSVGNEGEDYKKKVIELQDKIINGIGNKEKITSDIDGKDITFNAPLHTFVALLNIEAKTDILIGLIAKLLGGDDSEVISQILKEKVKSLPKEIEGLLERYKSDHVVDF